MSHLFIIQGNLVTPNPELLLLSPFKDIWERDTSLHKEVAKQEFGYIEFSISAMASNPFRDYSDDRKDSEIRKGLKLDAKWKPDKLIKQGIDFIDKVQTDGSISYRYWLSNKNVVEKQINFFDEIDLEERNAKTGNLVYKPADIPAAVEKAEKVLLVINNLKSKVDEELYETKKNKGGKTISPFADVNSLK